MERIIAEVIEALTEGIGELEYEDSILKEYRVNELHQRIQSSLLGDFGGSVGYEFTKNKGNKGLVIELRYVGDSRRVYSKDFGMMDSEDYISEADFRILRKELSGILEEFGLQETDLNIVIFRVEFGVNLLKGSKLPYEEFKVYEREEKESKVTEDEVYMEFTEISLNEDVGELEVVNYI